MGKHVKHKLSVKGIAGLKERGRYSDGGGLWLQVSAWGTKSWIFQYASPTQPPRIRRKNGEVLEVAPVRQLGLGSYLTVSLAKARKLAEDMREKVEAGIDPVEDRQKDRRTQRLAVAKRLTFEDAATAYIGAHRSSWRNDKHAAQWSSTLATFAFPILGDESVADIDTALVKKVLDAIWTSTPETAARLRGRIEAVLDYATAMKGRSGENPAAWRGNLKHLLPKHDKAGRHQPALPYDEIVTFLTELRPRSGISAKALEFTILTASRTGEVIGAKRREFNFEQRTWAIPAARMKAHREHKVPLSDRAVEILRALPQDGEYMFSGGKSGEPLSNMAMAEMVKQINDERQQRGLSRFVDPKQEDRDIVPHGFRSSFEDWAHETTNFPNHVIEMALAHKIGDKVEAAYRRGDLFAKRCELMKAWAVYCDRPLAPPADNVTPLRARSGEASTRP